MHAHDSPDLKKARGSRFVHPGGDTHADRQSNRPPTSLSPAALLTLQRTVGNAAVARLLGEQGAVERSTVPDVVASPGRPLAEPVRTEMESRFGADFSYVRVHTDEAARHSAAEIGARAYTVGSHVVLGEGGTDRHTLAHELVHVVQQRVGPVSGSDTGHGFRVSDPTDRFEREADAVATSALSRPPREETAPTDPVTARPLGTGDTQVQRAPKRPAEEEQSGSASRPKREESPGSATRDDSYGWDSESEQLAQQMDLDNPSAEHARALPQGKTDRVWATANQQKVDTKHEEQFAKALIRAFEESDDPKWTVQKWSANNLTNFRAFLRGGERSPARSFEGQREVQSLTWISTIIKEYLEKELKESPGEMQAAVGDIGRLIISTNRNRTNERVKELVARHGASGMLLHMIQANQVNQEINPVPDVPANLWPGSWERRTAEFHQWERARIVEHQDKAKNRLVTKADPKAREYKLVHEAIAKGVDVPDSKGVQDGLHAERRIAHHNGRTPSFMAGTKRPCISCTLALHKDPKTGARPGAFFGGTPSNIGLDLYQPGTANIDDQAKKVVSYLVAALGPLVSYKTVTWDCGAADDVLNARRQDATSESDTDAEGNKKPPR